MTLEEERKACLDRAAALMKKVEDEGRAMTEDEQKQYDADIARAEEIDKELESQAERAKKLAAIQERAQAVRSAVVNPLVNRGTFDGGQNAKDLNKFSLGKALRSLVNRGAIDGVEKEVFDEGAAEARNSQVGFDPRALVIPASALRALSHRATSVAGTNGTTVPVDVYPSIFEMFRNRQIGRASCRERV